MKNLVISTELSQVIAPVNAVNAYSLFKNEKIVLPRGYDKAIVSGEQVYGFVSNNFGLIKPMDVLNIFGEEFSKAELEFEPNGRIDNRGNFEIRFDFKNPNIDPKTKQVGDIISAMLAVGGGLAGSRSFYLRDMLKRLACLNGMTRTSAGAINLNKVRNTKNNHVSKLGIDFEKLIPMIHEFINSNDFLEEQARLVSMELKNEHVLPFFYEATKGTKFPESKFQAAFDRMKFEANQLGYTAMNRYLAYAGLNYIMEHDSMSLNLNQTSEIDSKIASRIEPMNIGMAVKNFNAIVKAESDRIESYKAEHEGKEPRGKRKVLELV